MTTQLKNLKPHFSGEVQDKCKKVKLPYLSPTLIDSTLKVFPPFTKEFMKLYIVLGLFLAEVNRTMQPKDLRDKCSFLLSGLSFLGRTIEKYMGVSSRKIRMLENFREK